MPGWSRFEDEAVRSSRRRRRRLFLLAALVACSAALAAIELREPGVGHAGPAALEEGTSGHPTSDAYPSTRRAQGLRELLTDLREVSHYRFAWLRSLANRAKGEVRVGLQVGHLDAAAAPDELEGLRQSTGGSGAGLDEVDVNLAVVTALASRLEATGILVDVLGATVPPGYRADLLLSIHADASDDPGRRGYKSAHFRPARNPREALLKVAVDRAYFAATRLPDDDGNVSGNMLFYYAFNDRRFEHSAHRSTPALLVELGYLTNESDRRWLERPGALAEALANGVMAYLREIRRLD